MKRFYRTYKINDKGEQLLASVYAENEEDAETEFEHTYQSSDEKEICWTSPIYKKEEATDNCEHKELRDITTILILDVDVVLTPKKLKQCISCKDIFIQ